MYEDEPDFREQALWEVAATNRAVERFQQDALRMDPHELPAGRRALVETVKPVAAVLDRWLDEAARVGADRRPAWHARFLNFTAETLAVVAVSTALRAGPAGEERMGQTLIVYGKRCAAALRDQADHDDWVAGGSGKNAPKDRADLVRRFQKANPTPDRRAWGRFCTRLEIERSRPWDQLTDASTEIGGALAMALSQAAPQGPTKAGEPLPWWFELRTCGDGPVKQRPVCLLLTEHAMEKMADVNARAELARPDMLPMIRPPIPWAYDEAVPAA